LLLTAGYDHKLNVLDVRERPLGENAIKIKVSKAYKDIESANWHPSLEHNFVVSTESGAVLGYDIRQPKLPIFNI
jgi:hypothetical protein